MSVQGRKRLTLGPITINLVSFLRWRITSWGIKVWRLSRNSRTRKWRFDIPGPFTWRSESTSARQGNGCSGGGRGSRS